MQISWQAQHFVNLEVQILCQAQHFVNLEVQISWQAQHLVNLEVHRHGSPLFAGQATGFATPLPYCVSSLGAHALRTNRTQQTSRVLDTSARLVTSIHCFNAPCA